MPLESGNFIPELDDANPPGTDPKSQGDDHIRLIKRTVLGSFPAFVGTTAIPKSVALTEDQINALTDAALKSIAETIAGQWTFTQAILAQGSVLVSDLGGIPLKAGFRNPGERASALASVTLVQGDEGQVVRLTGAAQTVGCPVLEIDTAITVKAAGSAAGTLSGTGTTFRLFDGKAQPVSVASLTVQPGAIIQLHYSATDIIDVWGSGVSA